MILCSFDWYDYAPPINLVLSSPGYVIWRGILNISDIALASSPPSSSSFFSSGSSFLFDIFEVIMLRSG